ncbi:MAG: hypothetical protein AAF429_14495 [Pseudomonadota bacterium]
MENMAMAAMPKTNRANRRDRGNIRSSQPGQNAVEQAELPALTRISAEYVASSLGNKSGFQTYDLTRGDATYKAITWGIRVNAAIADVTTETAGVHYVDLDHLKDYFGVVRLVPDGRALWSLDQSEIEKKNKFDGIDFGNSFSGLAFPGEFTYQDQRWTDAFSLGTDGMRSLTLEIELKDAFDADTMEIVVLPHVVDRVRPPGFVTRTERINTTFSGATKHTYTGVPYGDDISALWVQGANIQKVEVKIGRETLYDVDRAQYEAYLTEKGKDVAALESDWLFDVHAERVPRSIAALDGKNQRRRGNKITLEITTLDNETPVEIVVFNSDLYSKVR